MNTTDVNILIADDHKMIRDGLRLMLSLRNSEYNFFITEATDGSEAISISLKKDFDIILLDFRMPKFNGDDVVQRIRMYKPNSKFLILSNYDEKNFIEAAINRGANGYILKNIDTEDLICAIRTVLSGDSYFPGSVNLSEHSKETNPEEKLKALSQSVGLSAREIEVLRLIASEYTNEEIAQRLQISKRTVDTHRMNMLFKLKAKNTVGLIKFAYANNIME